MTTSKSRHALGVDIGGTKIAIAAVDGAGTIVASDVIPTEAELGFDRAVGRISDTAERLLERAGWSKASLVGVGVGCTGPVSAQRGIINNPYTLPTWIDCDIVSALGARFDRPLYLENDADAAVLGECFAGSARGHRSVVMLTLGTGVGGGVVIDGTVLRGTQGEHPELGHVPIDPTGPRCYCGTNGCLESIASGTAISAAGQAAGLENSREVFAKAAKGDPLAAAIVARAVAALGMATWTILHTFMPELIVLGGGVIDEHYDLFAPAVESQIAKATMVPPQGTRVVKAQLSNSAGIVGAASLALTRGV